MTETRDLDIIQVPPKWQWLMSKNQSVAEPAPCSVASFLCQHEVQFGARVGSYNCVEIYSSLQDKSENFRM